MLLRRPRHPPNVAFVQGHFSHIALIRRHVRSLAEADIRPWTAIRVLSRRAEEFHLRALPDTYVNLSIHTAPDVRPLP